MNEVRLEKINELIKREISQAINQQIDTSPEIFITVNEVITSQDIKEAKVYLSIFPFKQAQETLLKINRQIYELQQTLNHHLKMHPVPKIIFVLDETQEKQEKINQILKRVKK